MEPEPPGAGADPSRSEPKSAPGPWPSGAGAGAAQKSGGSATLGKSIDFCRPECVPLNSSVGTFIPIILRQVATVWGRVYSWGLRTEKFV